MYEDTGWVCDVGRYHDALPALQAVPISTNITVYDHPDGVTYIFAAGKSLFIGDSMMHSLLSPVQLQNNGLVVDTCMKQFSNGCSLHGIYLSDNDVVLPFHVSGCTSYLPIQLPTDHEIDNCEWIWHTDTDDEWDPSSDKWHDAENAYSSYKQNLTNHTFDHDGNRVIAATFCLEHQSNVAQPP